MHYVEFALLTLAAVGITDILAALLPVGPNSYEVREDYLYEVTLQQTFVFAGTTYSTVFISDNGVISLDSSFKGGALDSYTYGTPWIAPYGADVGGGSYGLLYFYEVPATDSSTFQTVTEIIRLEYPDALSTATSQHMLVTTWQDVRQFPATAENTLTCTFQAAIFSAGTETYVVFLYEDLQWGPAAVGVSSGEAENKFCICGSRTNVVTNLNNKGQKECNNNSGRFVFRVDSEAWITNSYTCTQIFTPRDCTAAASNTAARNRRCPAR